MSAPRVIGGALLALVAGVLAWLVLQERALPDAPAPVAWDRVRCARCRMLVGEPAFAAQLHTRGGAVLHFDDPGCLLLHVHQQRPEIHRTWFHHLDEDRWISGDAVRFVAAGPTPMGYGLGAADAGASPSLSQDAATERVLERERRRRGH